MKRIPFFTYALCFVAVCCFIGCFKATGILRTVGYVASAILFIAGLLVAYKAKK